jgi:N-acetylglucosaminyl-diphospho-decaprenol L-rhamnosyltransferase
MMPPDIPSSLPPTADQTTVSSDVPHSDTVAIVVVTHQSATHLDDLAQALLPQLRNDDKVVIVDNASTDDTLAVARALEEKVTVIDTGANLGFSGGCQVGARATQAPLLLFLNPDSQPHPDCIEQLRAAARRHPDWGAWQATVLTPDAKISGSGGVVHYLGIGYAGDSGRSLNALPSHDREITFPSGAAMVVRREAWEKVGGLDRRYFMYGEDLDLGLRLWLAGYRVGLIPEARVTHDHEFNKGTFKWFWLERNRWRTVLSVYPALLLVVVAPALVIAELGLIAAALRQGWLSPKLRAQATVIADLPRTLARRRVVQRTRRIGAAEFASHLTGSLDSPYMTAASNPLLRAPQLAYWWLVRQILTFFTPTASE